MTPLVDLIDGEVAAVDFRIEGMLMAPAQAIPRLLARQDLEGRTARALGDPRGLRLATACEARRRAGFSNGGAGSTAVAITSGARVDQDAHDDAQPGGRGRTDPGGHPSGSSAGARKRCVTQAMMNGNHP